MTPKELRIVLRSFGINQRQLGDLLRLDTRSIRRHIKDGPPPWVERMVEFLLEDKITIDDLARKARTRKELAALLKARKARKKPPPMTFEQFQETRRAWPDPSRRVYLDGTCYIEAVAPDAPERKEGVWKLPLMSEEWISNDLDWLERKLYDWAVSEGYGLPASFIASTS